MLAYSFVNISLVIIKHINLHQFQNTSLYFMRIFSKTIAFIVIFIFSIAAMAQESNVGKEKVLYETPSLVIKQIAPNAFMHISYKQTQDFGYVACNGLIVRDASEVVIFDTPTNDSTATELINWISQKLKCRINAIVPTHFHDDCLGGLKAFHQVNIPSYANAKTIQFAKANKYEAPNNGFTTTITLKVGNKKATVTFLGEGHTKDNVVGYFPSENILFGGCLIKALDASKGYVGDANVNEWSATVQKVKNAFPKVQIVVPGHGDFGNQQLLDYTIQLFQTK